MPEKVLFSWSGGKDSAMALYEMKRSKLLNFGFLIRVSNENADLTNFSEGLE